MAKNLINHSVVRQQLLATGNIKANTAPERTYRTHGDNKESQAAAIAARRKELGIKPVVVGKFTKHDANAAKYNYSKHESCGPATKPPMARMVAMINHKTETDQIIQDIANASIRHYESGAA